MLLGGVLGTMAGALTGSAIDRAEDRGAAKAVAAQQAANAITVTDVVNMVQSGVGEDTIIASILRQFLYVSTGGHGYRLSAQ